MEGVGKMVPGGKGRTRLALEEGMGNWRRMLVEMLLTQTTIDVLGTNIQYNPDLVRHVRLIEVDRRCSLWVWLLVPAPAGSVQVNFEGLSACRPGWAVSHRPHLPRPGATPKHGKQKKLLRRPRT